MSVSLVEVSTLQQLIPEHLVLFDGVCGLCNRSVDWLLRNDKKHRLRFAPLQGELASGLLPERSAALDTLLYISDGRVYEKSSAVLRMLWVVGGFWRISAILWVLQPFVGNLAYDFISKNRYRWFGKSETCRMPLPEERAYFLP